MRMNLPVSRHEHQYPAEQMLVSMTDTKGIITHCNHAFVDVSGFSYDELIGQNHNLVRHPDMPAAAYKDMWSTIGRGQPWTGLVKNRRKNGDFYWVQANVTPILESGKPKGYMSVRIKPSAHEVKEIEAVYAKINADNGRGTCPIFLKSGQVHYRGMRGWMGKLGQMTLTSRLGLAMAGVVVLGMVPQLILTGDTTALLTQLAALLVGSGLMMAWFQARVIKALQEAQGFANSLAGCNLTTKISGSYPAPMGSLIGSLRQIQINLQAVVGDVREEINTFTRSASEIAAGALDLSERTESQASSLEQTAASMEELSSTVKQTAETAAQVAQKSAESTDIVILGGAAVHHVGTAMQAIDESSSKVREIIGVIEGIAFQTNILALNAAVEAARAGEQGRGFAVVASEVRALAQRSAVAAKEIRELIAVSASQIQSGTQQMQTASQTIDNVVNAVREVGELIQIITNATKEQSLGISQVNEAVTHLDTVTQQNAALVEESAASSHDLSTSAVTLARAVQVFQLG